MTEFVRQISSEALRLKGRLPSQSRVSWKRFLRAVSQKVLNISKYKHSAPNHSHAKKTIPIRSSSQVCPKPHVTRGCPNAGWDPGSTGVCGPWPATSMPQESAPACQPSHDVSTSACATSLVCHLSVGHLAAWVAQREDSSGRATLAWTMQRPQTLPQDTTGSLRATAGSHSPDTFPELLFALTPAPLASLNFGLPLTIQHSTLRGSLSQSPSPPAPAVSYHQLPANNKAFSSEAGPEPFPISIRGTQNYMMTHFSTSHKLSFSTWGCSGACLVQILPSLFTHKSVDDKTQDFGAGERGIRSPKVFTCSH